MSQLYQPVLCRCRDCGLPLISGKEHREGYCRFCLIPNIVSNLSKRERLATEKNPNKSILTFNYINKRERLTEEEKDPQDVNNQSPDLPLNSVNPRNLTNSTHFTFFDLLFRYFCFFIYWIIEG